MDIKNFLKYSFIDWQLIVLKAVAKSIELNIEILHYKQCNKTRNYEIYYVFHIINKNKQIYSYVLIKWYNYNILFC